MSLARYLAFPLALFGITAPSSAQSANEAADVRINQSIMLGDLRVTPIAVLRDTRCVTDESSTCFTPGVAVIRFLVERNGKTGWIDVQSGSFARWQDLALAVTETLPARPARLRSVAISPEAYRFSVRRFPADVQLLE